MVRIGALWYGNFLGKLVDIPITFEFPKRESFNRTFQEFLEYEYEIFENLVVAATGIFRFSKLNLWLKGERSVINEHGGNPSRSCTNATRSRNMEGENGYIRIQKDFIYGSTSSYEFKIFRELPR